MDRCSNCGAPIEDGKCTYCGAVFQTVSSQPTNSANPSYTSANQSQTVINGINQAPINNQVSPKNKGVALLSAIFLGVCGAHAPINNQVSTTSPKNKGVALLLAIFLGVYGAHNFYVGKVGMGILYLFTFGLFFIGWLYDIYMIATGRFVDSNGLILK